MSDHIDIKELLTRYQAWGKMAGPKYAQRQWLLSKWDNCEGVAWSPEKFSALLQSIREGLAIQPTDRMADLGCGGGWITNALAKDSPRIIGVDFSSMMLQQASQCFSHIPFVNAEISQLPFKNNTFDCILCYFVFVNFTDDDFSAKCFAEISRVLKPGGRALIGQLPDQDGSLHYDVAKKKYFEYCQENFKLGVSNRDTEYMPQKLYDRNRLKKTLGTLNIPHRLVDSFNPFYYNGQPKRIPWRFDVILNKQ